MGNGIVKLCMFCDKRLSDEDVRSLVVCIDCWRNPELIKKENANSGYPLLGEVRADVQELLQMIAEIPCTCDKIYTDRKLRAPDCPRCNWVEDDIVKKVNEHFA